MNVETCQRPVTRKVGTMSQPMCEHHIGERAARIRVMEAELRMGRLFGSVGTSELNALCREHTGFSTLPETFASADYRPSFYTTPRSGKAAHVLEASVMRRLADAYDALAADMGDKRRAYRGGEA